MAIYQNYGMLSAPPSNYTRYGEGNFLVQHWGASFVFTKNGDDWYKIEGNQKVKKYKEENINEVVLNKNDKTINSTYDMLKLNFLEIQYVSTGTAGTRELALRVLDPEDEASARFNIITIAASTSLRLIFTPSGNEVEGVNNITLVKPLGFDFTELFNSALRFNDDADVDDNDDMYIYGRGFLYKPKLTNYKIKNCTDFAITYETEKQNTFTEGFQSNVIPLP